MSPTRMLCNCFHLPSHLAIKVEVTSGHCPESQCNLLITLTLGHFLDKFHMKQIFLNRKPLCKTIYRFL